MSGSKCKSSGDVAGAAKNYQVLMIERGEKMIDIARSYNMNRSTIRTIVKNKDKIMEHVKSAVPIMSTIISKKHGKVMEEVEKLLSVWMQDQHQC